MLRHAIALAAMSTALMIAAPVSAQDIAPVISPGQVAEGVYYRSRMSTKTARQPQARTAKPAPGTPEFQRQACANRPMFRRQYGANHPQVLKLDALCKQSGY